MITYESTVVRDFRKCCDHEDKCTAWNAKENIGHSMHSMDLIGVNGNFFYFY